MRPTATGRRKFLKAAAVAGAGAFLAGCTSTGTQSGDGSSGSDGGASATNNSTGGTSGNSGMQTFGGWLDGTKYDGSVTEKTGTGDVTVTVGAETSSGPYAFAPPAIKIGTGTTVIWKWTGKGGSHNVVAQDGGFESELRAEKGYTFEHTFDSSGTYKYFCAPHKTMGMKGVVVVD